MGSLRGVRVRDGGKVDVTWNGGRRTEFRLEVEQSARYRVAYDGKSISVEVEPKKNDCLGLFLTAGICFYTLAPQWQKEVGEGPQMSSHSSL